MTLLLDKINKLTEYLNISVAKTRTEEYDKINTFMESS
jgi:hypothetical protein